MSADGGEREGRLKLSARLAILTAVFAVALVLSGSQIALTWSQRNRVEVDRRDAVSLAATLASYLTSAAPDGDPDSLTRAFQAWARSDVSGADAWVYALVNGDLVALPAADGSLGPVDALDRKALAARAMEVEFRRAPNPAWWIAVPLGTPRPHGVLSVTLATEQLAGLAAERRLAYAAAVASALLVALSVAWLTAHWVGRPLHAIGHAMAHARQSLGPASEAPEIGPQEFRVLARRYNELLHALADRQRESEARAALLNLEERARNYDRLAVSAETTAELAHEIGTPLSTMRGHIQLLHDDLVAAGQTRSVERITSLLSQLDRVTTIVRAGLEWGSWPAPALTVADLSEIATRLLRFLEPSLEQAGVRAEFGRRGAGGDGRALATCDPALVEQILLNLLKNAIEALPAGGRIRLTTSVENGTAYVEVADDGPGLPAEARAMLFSPFATTKGTGGTGLGLVISRRLARALGGELAHVPAERGTAWRLNLPAAP